MQSGGSWLVPDCMPKHLKNKKLSPPYCVLIPRWACGSLGSDDMPVMDASRVEESSQGRALREVGLWWGGGGHSPDCQTASLQLQLPRIQRLARSQGQHDRAHSGPFTVEWSHTRSSLAQASSGTRQNSLCSTPQDKTMAISSEPSSYETNNDCL